MFEFAEVSFDQIALAIDVAVDGSLDFAVALCGDVSDSAHCLDLLDEGAGIVAAVSDHVADAFQAGDKPRAWPCDSANRIGRPASSTMTWIFVLNPPRERPMA